MYKNKIRTLIISSYRMNLLRDNYFYYNRNKNTLDDTLEISEVRLTAESRIDLLIVLDIIKDQFGEDLFNAYYRYISEDISLAKLQEESGIKNLKLKIKKIKDFIQKEKENLN